MATENETEHTVPMKSVKTVLISQPKPERSPYFKLEEKYGLTIDFRKFIQVEGFTAKEFRKQRLKLSDFSAVIFTSKNSVQHFFRLVEETRDTMSPDTKYFCLNEALALYLQKFIVYRKRKVFNGKRTLKDLQAVLKRHKKNETFIYPTSEGGRTDIADFLAEAGFNSTTSPMYRTVSSDLSDLSDITYDMLVFFSPLGIKSLLENFPDFKQNDTRIATFGGSTLQAAEDAGLNIQVKAPQPEAPSMTMAIERYVQQSNKK